MDWLKYYYWNGTADSMVHNIIHLQIELHWSLLRAIFLSMHLSLVHITCLTVESIFLVKFVIVNKVNGVDVYLLIYFILDSIVRNCKFPINRIGVIHYPLQINIKNLLIFFKWAVSFIYFFDLLIKMRFFFFDVRCIILIYISNQGLFSVLFLQEMP